MNESDSPYIMKQVWGKATKFHKTWMSCEKVIKYNIPGAAVSSSPSLIRVNIFERKSVVTLEIFESRFAPIFW